MAFNPPLCQVLINTGSGPNDGTGDSIRVAFEKVNSALSTLYTGGGPSGPVGPLGPSGPQGAHGSQGNQGAIGVQGMSGSQGMVGAQGCQGVIGYQGAQGATGYQGYQGNSGSQGSPGAAGSNGLTGQKGSQGSAGYQGSPGAQGSPGFQGSQGVPGPVAGTNGQIIYNNSGSPAGFGNTNGTDLNIYGNVTAYYTSDIKFKENIADITNALSIVNAIGGKTYDWSDQYIAGKGGEDGYHIQKNDFGVIAQDVQSAFPLAVRVKADGTLAVDYQKLVALAFAAIKELTDRVNQLESKKEE